MNSDFLFIEFKILYIFYFNIDKKILKSYLNVLLAIFLSIIIQNIEI